MINRTLTMNDQNEVATVMACMWNAIQLLQTKKSSGFEDMLSAAGMGKPLTDELERLKELFVRTVRQCVESEYQDEIIQDFHSNLQKLDDNVKQTIQNEMDQNDIPMAN